MEIRLQVELQIQAIYDKQQIQLFLQDSAKDTIENNLSLPSHNYRRTTAKK